MRDGIRIRHLEPPLLEVVAIIEQRSTDKQSTLGINNDANIVGLNENIAVCRPIDEIHFVLKPGTTAANHGNTKCPLRATLPVQQLRKLRRSGGGYLHQTLVADLVLNFSRFSHPGIWNLRAAKATAPRPQQSRNRRIDQPAKITSRGHGTEATSSLQAGNEWPRSGDYFEFVRARGQILSDSVSGLEPPDMSLSNRFDIPDINNLLQFRAQQAASWHPF